MLRHKNLKTIQHYAKILDLKVSDDMKILKEMFGNENRLSIKSRRENLSLPFISAGYSTLIVYNGATK